VKSTPKIVALIPARGGSKGVPRKNIRELAGKPLIAYAIQTALASSLIDRVVVSTEDEEIAEIARQWGAEVPFMRPTALAQDESPEWLTWQHAITELQALDDDFEMRAFVCVPATAPLRTVEDVDLCIRAFLEDDADLVITVKPADRSPYFNMVLLDDQGYAHLPLTTSGKVKRRQDSPQLYDMTTVAYAARPEFVLNSSWMFEGTVKAVQVPVERSIDIDTEMDLAFAEYMITQWLPRQPKADRGSSTENAPIIGRG
jgi:N-acylneuraminate cytidylyltransferase